MWCTVPNSSTFPKRSQVSVTAVFAGVAAFNLIGMWLDSVAVLSKFTMSSKDRKTGELRIVFAVWIPPSGETGHGALGATVSYACLVTVFWHLKQIFHLTCFSHVFNTSFAFCSTCAVKAGGVNELVADCKGCRHAGRMLGTHKIAEIGGSSFCLMGFNHCRKTPGVFWRHWLPLLWHYPLAFAVDTFTLAGFSPGLSLYVYNKDPTKKTRWLPFGCLKGGTMGVNVSSKYTKKTNLLLDSASGRCGSHREFCAGNEDVQNLAVKSRRFRLGCFWMLGGCQRWVPGNC